MDTVDLQLGDLVDVRAPLTPTDPLSNGFYRPQCAARNSRNLKSTVGLVVRPDEATILPRPAQSRYAAHPNLVAQEQRVVGPIWDLRRARRGQIV
jgi:hypothetical protein